MMSKNLSVTERLALLSLLPSQGDATTLKIVRQLREDLSFTEDEHEQYGIVVKDGKCTWDAAASSDGKDIAIGRKAREIIVAVLEDKDKRKQLEDGHLCVWDRFVAEDERDLKLTETAG